MVNGDVNTQTPRLSAHFFISTCPWRGKKNSCRPRQLLWLKQPSALKVLLQRPVWLRARGGSERSAAPRCWAGLPADVFGIIM